MKAEMETQELSSIGFGVLADAVVVLHVGFIIFVLLGGLLCGKRPGAAWAHVPAVAWAAATEFFGRTCPLTPLENWLRACGGGAGYKEGFVEHYILPLLYPAGLDRAGELLLGSVALGVNALVYWRVIRQHTLSGWPSRPMRHKPSS